jgi:hypothetical protein
MYFARGKWLCADCARWLVVASIFLLLEHHAGGRPQGRPCAHKTASPISSVFQRDLQTSCCCGWENADRRANRDESIAGWTHAVVIVVLVCGIHGLRAEVTRIEIFPRTDVLGGKPFGPSGACEKIVGKIFMPLF